MKTLNPTIAAPSYHIHLGPLSIIVQGCKHIGDEEKFLNINF